jgi:hypothetical protein
LVPAGALADGEITLSQAEAVTLAPDSMQERILEKIASGHSGFSADDIRTMVLSTAVAWAILHRGYHDRPFCRG